MWVLVQTRTSLKWYFWPGQSQPPDRVLGHFEEATPKHGGPCISGPGAGILLALPVAYVQDVLGSI